jgi:hypothetical protein
MFRPLNAIFRPNIEEYTGFFIISSIITNIYNKKIKEPTLMELFTATGKLKRFFLTTSFQNKNFFTFPVTVNNSIKVGSMVFLL